MRFWREKVNLGVLTCCLCLLVSSAIPTARGQEQVSNSLAMNLRFVPAGHFVQGDTARVDAVFSKDHPGRNPADEDPAHPVRLTRPFYLSVTEVTVGQFRAFIEASGYRTTAEKGETKAVGFKPIMRNDRLNLKQPFNRGEEFDWKNPGFEQTDQHPVVCVSWQDAQAFCRWLSQEEGAKYRLPTEAEWEYACRAGSQTAFAWGDEYRQRIHAMANIGNVELERAHADLAVRRGFLDVENDPVDQHVFTAPVGSFPANAWGLQDMHGNVWEWCHDTYRDTFYTQYRSPRYPLPHQTAIDPVSEEPMNQFGDWRVIRGGSWYTAPIMCRSDVRGYFDAPDAACYLGFRVVREAPPEAIAAAKEEWQKEQQAIARLKEVIGDFRAPNGTMFERTARFNQGRLTAAVTEDLYRISLLTGISANRVEATSLQHFSKMKELKNLEIQDIRELADADLVHLARLTSLEGLTLAGASQLTNDCISHLAGLTNLKRLRLSGAAITDEGLTQLRSLKNLEELSLRDTRAEGAILSSLGEIPLKQLDLPDLSDEYAASLAGLADLEQLSCTGPSLTDRGLAHFAGLTRLTSLNLHRCRSISPSGFESLRPLTRLTSLGLSETQAGDEAMRQLAHHYWLTSLSVGSEHLTNEGMHHICEIISLQHLNIGGEARVSDEGLRDLWRLQRLNSLAIDVDGLTGSGFAPLAEARNLRRLVLRSSKLTDEALDHISTLPALQQLVLGDDRLGGLSAVTGEGLLLLADAERLTNLELAAKTTQLTDEAVDRLQQARPDMNIQVRR